MDMILLSGGIGKRAKLNYPKQLMRLGGKPMLIHVLEIFRKVKSIGKITITVPENIKYYDELINKYNISNFECILGGNTRQESVKKALLYCNTKEVMIHESVRPFINKEFIQKIIDEPSENAVPTLRSNPTMIYNNGKKVEYLERDFTYEIQLPQKFNYEDLLCAHLKAHYSNANFTDDSSLLSYYFDVDLKYIDGLEENIKITTPLDIRIARCIYEEYSVSNRR